MKTLISFLNHERYKVVAGLIVVALLIVWFGCDSKVKSIRNPDRWITRGELNAELEYFAANLESESLRIQAQGETKFLALDRQDAFKRWVAENAAFYAETGIVNPGGLILSLLAIGGVGAGVDDWRTRKRIKPVAAGTAASSPPT